MMDNIDSYYDLMPDDQQIVLKKFIQAISEKEEPITLSSFHHSISHIIQHYPFPFCRILGLTIAEFDLKQKNVITVFISENCEKYLSDVDAKTKELLYYFALPLDETHTAALVEKISEHCDRPNVASLVHFTLIGLKRGDISKAIALKRNLKSKSNWMFVKAHHFHEHWICSVENRLEYFSEQQLDVLKVVKLVNAFNQRWHNESGNGFDEYILCARQFLEESKVSPRLGLYKNEMCRHINLIKFIYDHRPGSCLNVFDISSKYSILNYLCNTLDLSKIDHNETIQLLSDNYNRNLEIIKSYRGSDVSGNPINLEVNLFKEYVVLKSCIEIIYFDPADVDFTKRVHKNLSVAKSLLLDVDRVSVSSLVRVLERIFTLLFLRKEFVMTKRKSIIAFSLQQLDPAVTAEDKNRSSKTGFVCHELAVQKLLHFLSKMLNENRISQIFETDDAALKNKIARLKSFVEEGLWRFTLCTTALKDQENICKAVLLTSYKNEKLLQLYSPILATPNTSDDEVFDKKVKMTSSLSSRRRNKKRAQARTTNVSKPCPESSVSSNTPVEEKSSVSNEPVTFRNSENNHIIKETSIVSKMLSTVKNLAIMYMSYDGLTDVREIMKVFELENKLVYQELKLFEEIQNTKKKIDKILENYKQLELLHENENSTIGLIMKVTEIGLEASKIVNHINKFETNIFSLNSEHEMLIEKYEKQYKFLRNYKTDKVQATIVVDFLISLACNYDIALTFYNTIKKKWQSKSPSIELSDIGYEKFIKNLLNCLHVLKSTNRENMTVATFLTSMCYSFNDDQEFQSRISNELLFKANYKRDYKDLYFTNEADDFMVDFIQVQPRQYDYFSSLFDYLNRLQSLHSDKMTANDLLGVSMIEVYARKVIDKVIKPEMIQRILPNDNINMFYTISKLVCHTNAIFSDHHFESTTFNEIPSITDEVIKILEEMVQNMSPLNSLLSFILQKILGINVPDDNSLCSMYFDNFEGLEEIENIASLFQQPSISIALKYDQLNVEHVKDICENSNLSVEFKMEALKAISGKNQYRKIDLFIATQEDLIHSYIESTKCVLEIEKLSDINLKMSLLTRFLNTITEVQVVIRIINHILLNKKSHLLAENDKLLLSMLLDDIPMFEEISAIFSLSSWVEAKQFSSQQPQKVLQQLVTNKHYTICSVWFERFTQNEIILDQAIEIFSSSLLEVEYEVGELYQIFSLIEKLPEQDILQCFKMLLPKLQTKTSIDYILKFMVKHEKDLSLVQKYHISLEIIEKIHSSNDVKLFWNILAMPLIIIEQLLMNCKFEMLTKAFGNIHRYLHHGTCDICDKNYESLDIFNVSVSSLCDSDHSNVFLKVTCLDYLLRAYAARALQCIELKKKPKSAIPLISNDEPKTALTELVSKIFVMPATIPTKADWIPDGNVTVCMCCNRSVFTILTRRHHCRRCGRVVCHLCSNNRSKIDGYVLDIPVRVCLNCFNQMALPLLADTVDASGDSISVVKTSFHWQLTGKEYIDNFVREEFSYDHVPSPSMCLTILGLHSADDNKLTNFLSVNCKKFESMLFSLSPGSLNSSIDYSLITRIVHCLAVAGKLKGSDSFESSIDHAEVSAVMIRNRCESYLAQLDCFDMAKLRNLIDSLVHSEAWILAMELSLKCGFSTVSTMAAWGLSCLKNGCFATAREKLTHCMPQACDQTIYDQTIAQLNDKKFNAKKCDNSTNASKRPTRSPVLLVEILNIFESKRYFNRSLFPIRTQSLTSSTTANSASRERSLTHEPPLHILNRLKNLSNIIKGDTVKIEKNSLNENRIQNRDECLFYLIKFGSHTDVVSFFVRNECLTDALKYILIETVEPDIFTENIYLPCLRHGQVDQLLLDMMEIDKTMLAWHIYIIKVCRYLEIYQLFNSLYQIQVLLDDPIRASMTCVKFYSLNSTSYSELQKKTFHLQHAQVHLQSELELCLAEELEMKPKRAPNNLAMKLNSKSINNHINTIRRQIEVTKFLASCEQNNKAKTVLILPKIFNDSCTIPTLFGSYQQKMQIAVLTIISGKNVEEGFGLAVRILQDYNIDGIKVYGLTANYFVLHNRICDVERLINCIRTNNGTESKCCDEILVQLVETALDVNDLKIVADIESFINLIEDVSLKISCLISIGKLKAAYLLAIQDNRENDIRKILKKADSLNQTYIKKLCEKKLDSVNTKKNNNL